MSHPGQPEYFTITMRAVCFRLQRMYSSCGDEYRVECFHVSNAEAEAMELTEQQVNRAKYQKEERDKEQAVKELAEIKAKEVQAA